MRKDNNDSFNRDVRLMGRYKYTDPGSFSAYIANERYTEMILNNLNLSEKVVIDVGCGDGTYTADLAQRSNAKLIVGIDPAVSAIERARQMYETKYKNIKFEIKTPDNLDFNNYQFDVAIYRGVLHHTDNPEKEIENALKLAPKILFLEPNGLNIFMKIVERISEYHIQHNERSFSHYKLARWVKTHKGKMEKIKFFGLVPYFCPDIIARIGRFLEPVLERVPLLRMFYCGQYIMVISRI